jgi:hypothetical protein
MSFLTSLARSSAVFTCERSLASCSSRIARPVVVAANNAAAVAPATLRRHGTQTPDQRVAASGSLWETVNKAMKSVPTHRRDMTPGEAWENRSTSKHQRLQDAPLAGPSTGTSPRHVARLFRFLLAFLFLFTHFFFFFFFSRSDRLRR